MKKIISLLIIAVIILLCFTSCKKADEKQKFSESFIEYFDTVATVTGFCSSVEEFDKIADDVEYMLKSYHELFDIYNTYSGVNNLATVNSKAGVEKVTVDERIIDLVDYSKEMYTLTKGKTDVTLGAVLKLWHDKREEGILDPENATLPDYERLKEAALLRGFEKIEIDRENNTVFITEKGIALDVGAIAKGYATEKIALQLEGRGVTGFALNIGGNIRVIGDKPGGEKWTAAVKDPIGDGSVLTINMDKKSFVTSGSYQRFYTVDGKNYHHIIDPQTLYPSNEFNSVSILTDDSGKADCLSTALFSMSLEEGREVIENIPDTEALWLTADGKIIYSSGFEKSVVKDSYK